MSGIPDRHREQDHQPLPAREIIFNNLSPSTEVMYAFEGLSSRRQTPRGVQDRQGQEGGQLPGFHRGDQVVRVRGQVFPPCRHQHECTRVHAHHQEGGRQDRRAPLRPASRHHPARLVAHQGEPHLHRAQGDKDAQVRGSQSDQGARFRLFRHHRKAAAHFHELDLPLHHELRVPSSC